MSAPGTDVVEPTTTELVVPTEFAEFVPDDLPRSKEAVEVWVARAKETVATIEINTEEDAEAARDLLQEYAREEKRFEEERVALTKPRKDAAEFIKKKFDGAKQPFAEAKADLSQRLKDWVDANEKEQREAQRVREEERRRVEQEARAKREAAEKAEREAAQMAAEAETPDDAAVAAKLEAEAKREAERASVTEQAIGSLPNQPPVSKPKLAGFSTRKRWVRKSVDKTQLPSEYLMPDLGAIDGAMREAVKETGGPPEIPGVVFEQVEGTAVRT